MTMETAPVENSEYAEEPVAKKLTSVQTTKSNAQMYFAIAVAMVEAMMFGLDQGNFGNVQTYECFQKHWCEGKFGNEVSCHSPGVDGNHVWLCRYLYSLRCTPCYRFTLH